MINFRYHIVSLIAVFLALAIGVIMGSAVIDRAIVDRLEDQQRDLEERIDDVETENDTLREENQGLRATADLLAEQGGQRLLAGALVDVPVVIVATRGVDGSSFEGLLSLLATTGADQRGTIWLTDRFALDGDDEVRDLASALELAESAGADRLRTAALTRLSTMLRAGAGPSVIDDPSLPSDGDATGEDLAGDSDVPAVDELAPVFAALRDAGFVDFDAPDGASEDGPILTPGTRVVLVSGAASDVPVDLVSAPFAGLLVEDRASTPPVALLAAEARSITEPPAQEFVVVLREADHTAERLSTVDNIDDFAGRLAAVLAIVDLGDGRIGHYGRGPSAQRLLPAPQESDG